MSTTLTLGGIYPLNDPSGQVVVAGAAPQWSDESDSTYAKINAESTANVTMSAAATIAAPPSGRLTGLDFRLRMYGTDGTGSLQPIIRIVDSDRSSSQYTLDGSWSVGTRADFGVAAQWIGAGVQTPANDAIVEVTGSLAIASDITERLAGGTAIVSVAVYSAVRVTGTHLTVYELDLFGTFEGAPLGHPCRKTGRGDGLGLSVKRHWPPPKTQQGSARRGNATY